MSTIGDVAGWLNDLAPGSLAEDWDNVGLLVGDPLAKVRRVMTCLTITPDSASEAIERKAELVVTHHPLPFHSLKKITTESTPGRLLWNLIRSGVAIYSPHTALDSAAEGINQQLAELIGLQQIAPLVPADEFPHLGSGRYGRLAKPVSVKEITERLSNSLGQQTFRGVVVNDPVETIAVACGSAGQFIRQARELGCQLLVTGEASFHICLEAEASAISLLLLGHFASERFALVRLAERLQTAIPELEVWASQREQDPIRII